ncbi:FeoA family protein [Flavobacterium sp.]|uniref:FeoA family protein n=1 Tax=Flavobacterium sp. TaxID=239 RepID=UPI002FDA7F81
METTVDQLKKGEKAIIIGFDLESIPLKLIEMGCMEGHWIELVQVAPLGDPLYLEINGAHLAIRKDMAKEIQVEIIQN